MRVENFDQNDTRLSHRAENSILGWNHLDLFHAYTKRVPWQQKMFFIEQKCPCETDESSLAYKVLTGFSQSQLQLQMQYSLWFWIAFAQKGEMKTKVRFHLNFFVHGFTDMRRNCLWKENESFMQRNAQMREKENIICSHFYICIDNSWW